MKVLPVSLTFWEATGLELSSQKTVHNDKGNFWRPIP